MTSLSPLHVVQITDIHLFEDSNQLLLGLSTIESFQAVLKQVLALDPKPDLLLLSGDLSQDGRPESYRILQKLLLPLGIPTYWLPGNHDCCPTMEPILNKPPIFPQKAFLFGGWSFLLLNSQVPGCVHGYLDSTSLGWLDQQLHAAKEYPTLVGLHHPPFVVGSDWLDGSTLKNPQDLFSVLDCHPQVKLVLFGHIHQDYSNSRCGVKYLGTPSTCIQFEPRSSDFALDRESPGFRLLHLYPDGTWWTTVERTSYSYEPDLVARGY